MAASKTALTLLKPSISRARSLASSPLLGAKLSLIPNVVPFNFSIVADFHAPFFPGIYFSSSLIDKLEFTKMEWEGIANLIFEARVIYGAVETEDFMRVLMEQKYGMAGRIFSKAGLDNTSILQAIHDFISKKHPKVKVDTSPLRLGEHLNSFLENAIKHKKDEIVSVEHFILAFHMDKRFGQHMLTNFGLSEKDLRDAIHTVRGSQKRELSEHWGIEKELINRIPTLKEENATLITLHRELEEAEKHLAEIVSKWTGTRFEDALHQGVVGQNMAVRSVADAIRRSRAGQSNPNRPVASFMFMGSTGVGKKTLANALADYLFNTEENLEDYLYNTVVRIDMGEYMGKHAVSRLVVALGYREKEVLVQLTEFVRHRPYCLILFEEIEKAHPNVLSILLQVLDNGKITDCQGKTVCFKNTVIIMTSTIGSHLIQDTLSSNTHDTHEVIYDIMKKQVVDLARETFSPEFMNCIDECIVFKPLDASEIRNLAEIWINWWKEDLKQAKVELHYTEKVIDVVERLFYHPNSVKMAVKKYFMYHLEKTRRDLVDLVPHNFDLVKVDVNSDLGLGLVRGGTWCEGSEDSCCYEIYLGTDETGIFSEWLSSSEVYKLDHSRQLRTYTSTGPKQRKNPHAEIILQLRRSSGPME